MAVGGRPDDDVMFPGKAGGSRKGKCPPAPPGNTPRGERQNPKDGARQWKTRQSASSTDGIRGHLRKRKIKHAKA